MTPLPASYSWLCPGCGRIVGLPTTALGPGPTAGFERDPRQLDRLAHALCGCYVFTMTESSLGRLLASIMASENPPRDDDISGD